MTIVATFLITWELYLSIFVIFIVTRIIKWLTDPLRKIPGPRGYPIIGNTLDYSLSNDLQKVLLERAKKYGKIYKDYTFFSKGYFDKRVIKLHMFALRMSNLSESPI